MSNQPLIDRYTILAVVVLILTGCAAPVDTAETTVRTPWHTIQKVSNSAPNEQPALWTDGNVTLAAWPGEPGDPGIRLANSTNPPVVLPLGTLPHQIALYPADAGLLDLLWLDQTQPDETRLVTALVTTDGKVERNANAISTKSTAHYAAVMLTDGNVLTLWTQSGQYTPLYAQLLDGEGRAHPPVRLSNDASDPSGVLDLNGTLHLAWLERERAQSWTIHYLNFAAGSLPDTDNPTSTPIGVIRLGANITLESFGLGVDADHVYCLWETLSLGTAGQPVGALAGLDFPLGDATNVQSLKFDTLNAQSVRRLAMPNRASKSLNVGLSASTWDGQSWHDTPLVVAITPDKAVSYPVFEKPGDVIGKTTLATDTAGKLYLAWTALKADGTAVVYEATTR